MKKFAVTMLIFLSFALQAQTKLTIIGTMHNPTGKINSDSILNVLKKIKPDVILMELDSSLMDSTGRVLYQFKSNENTAVADYEKEHKVIKRPFDYKYRNKYYKEHNTFNLEDRFSKLIDSLYLAGALDPLSKNIYEFNRRINGVLSKFDKEDLITINKESTSALMELRQDMSYKDLLKICINVPGMASVKDFWKENGDFWEFRNMEMTANIVKYAKEFTDKKIVVLVGYYHKYALMKNLKKELKDSEIIIKEFWEY